MVPFVDIHTHDPGEYPGVLSLYSCRLGVDPLPALGRPYWCGVHPWDVGRVSNACMDILEKADAAGVGEIGLDFLSGRPERALQLEWFERQMRIAAFRGMPVALHLVRAHGEGLALIRKYRKSLPAVILHGFVGGRELARQYLSLGCMLSFSERALHSPKTRDAFYGADLSAVFLESDDASPSDMENLYGRFAVLRGTGVDGLKDRLFENYMNIFSEWNG